jgi:hypothetical protein
MHDPADEALIQEILPVLDLEHQYTRLVEAWNHDLVAQIRRCGRLAGSGGWVTRSGPLRATQTSATTGALWSG